MANNHVVNELNRFEKALVARAAQWRSVFRALEDAEAEAWSKFTNALRKTGLDVSWEHTRKSVMGWPAEAFNNIRVGGVPASDLSTLFLTPLKIGLKMILYGALREKPDFSANMSQGPYWSYNLYDVALNAFDGLTEIMAGQMSGGLGVAGELRRLANHVNGLREGVSIHDVTAGLLAMLYSPVFHPTAALPQRLALSYEIHLWSHYLVYLTGRDEVYMQRLDERHRLVWRDYSSIFERLTEFGWNRIAADFSGDMATVRTKLNAWCKQQIKQPLGIDVNFSPKISAYITHFKERRDLVRFFKSGGGLSWSDVGI